MGQSESTTRQNLKDKPTVLIIGGGVSGTNLAKDIDSQFNVVILERRNYFLIMHASLRASVNAGLSKSMLVPYTKLLKYGYVLQAEVEEITSAGVKISGREELLKFDFLVIATGWRYSFPVKVAETDYKKVYPLYQETQQAIEEAEKILIIGGGVVATELVGEIHAKHPNKKITMVHSRDHLNMGKARKELAEELLNQIKTFSNVEVVFNEKVQLSEGRGREELYGKYIFEKNAHYETDKGRKIETDLVFFCTGVIPNSAPFVNHFPVTEDGLLKVNSALQVEGHPNVFAIGDINNIDATKQGYNARNQGRFMAKNLMNAYLKKELEPFDAGPPMMAVPLGLDKGATQVPNSSGTIFKSFFTSMVKGKSLFVPSYWQHLNMSYPGTNPADYDNIDYSTEHYNNDTDLKRLAQILKIEDMDQVKSLVTGTQTS